MPSGSAFVCVLMLDTRFPRPPGDIGNAETFRRHGIPVRFCVVKGASAQRVVKEGDRSLLQPFVDAALELVGQGAALITTSCGFLASFQDALVDAVSVPVITSSLLQCSRFACPGIVTFDADALSPKILHAAGVPDGTPVEGLNPGCELQRRIFHNETQLDVLEAQRNVVDAALRLIRRCPNVADIVLECTNMPPYREAVALATGRRVHDIETLVVNFWNSNDRSGSASCAS